MDQGTAARTAEELRRSLLHQQAILDNIPDIAWLKDRESRFLAVNAPFGEACGLPPEQIIGKTDLDIWPHELAESYRDDDAVVIRTGARKRVEERLVGPDGRVRWIETIKSPVVDRAGVVIGTTGIARDITERREAQQRRQRMEQALLESTERLNFIMANSPAVIYTCRPSGDFGATSMTENVRRLLGHEAADFVSNSGLWFSGLHPDDAPRVTAGIATLLEDGAHADEYRFRHRDGTWRWMHDEQRLIRDAAGAPLEIVGFWVDITDRKRAEEELARRTQGLATLLEASARLAATLDLDVVLQATTDGVTRLSALDTAAVYLLEGDLLRLGATTPPLPPSFPEQLRITRLDDHPHARAALACVAPAVLADAREAELSPGERAAVELRDLRTLVFLPLVAGETPVGVLIVGSVREPRPVPDAEIDLCLTLANLAALATQNARLYTAAQRHAADLERQIAERHRTELERLELERRLLHSQKLESLGILAGGIAHDFNNLLLAVLGNLDLALHKLPPGSPARENIEHSAQAAHRAADLTRQMLAYSGKGRFLVEETDLNRIVQDNAHLFRASVARTTALDLRLCRPLPAIDADPGQIQQVIMNLITNAAEAIGERPGVIAMTTGAQDCSAAELRRSRGDGAPSPGRFVFLEVADTGHGMDEQTLNRLFDPFFSTKGIGRGLGMSALLGIVRGHRGAIFVDSAVGRGTTIRVLFPAREPSPARSPSAAAVAAREAPAPGAGGTVLVVDDEELVRSISREMLQSFGLQVLTAVDGREGVEIFRRHAREIDLVLLDLSMPNLDGRATFEELIRIEPRVRVILSSGYNEQESVQRLAARGLAGFIQKPYSLRNLRDLLTKEGVLRP